MAVKHVELVQTIVECAPIAVMETVMALMIVAVAQVIVEPVLTYVEMMSVVQLKIVAIVQGIVEDVTLILVTTT